jgi:hypothetical protein
MHCCHCDGEILVARMAGGPYTVERYDEARRVAGCPRPPVALDINGDSWCLEHAPAVLARDASTVAAYARALAVGAAGLALAWALGEP